MARRGGARGALPGEAPRPGSCVEVSRYTICYRCKGSRGGVALIVEDRHGAAYLFSGGALQLRLGGDGAPARLALLLARRVRCMAVPSPDAASYTLDELCRLVPVPVVWGGAGRDGTAIMESSA